MRPVAADAGELRPAGRCSAVPHGAAREGEREVVGARLPSQPVLVRAAGFRGYVSRERPCASVATPTARSE